MNCSRRLDPDVRKLLDDAAPGIEPPVDAKQRNLRASCASVALLRLAHGHHPAL